MSMLPADVHRRLDVIDTGDSVLHGPTGEEWLVAHVEGDRLAWCGWPPGLAALSDCTLVKKATPEARDDLLRELADMQGDDFRARHARHRLEQIPQPTGEEHFAKNSLDAYKALGKTNLLMFDPESLTLVTDEASPLYDERVHLPLDEAMVLNIMALGVLQPITVRKNPETGGTEVVVGRQRVKSAREANKRLAAQGSPTIRVPATVQRADAVTLAGHVVSENELRKADTPLGRARKMAALLGRGRTEADLALLFGCSSATVKSTLALLDCCAAVRNAVEAGKVNVGQALKLSKLDDGAQREKVAELIAAGDGAKGHAKARAQREVMGEAKPRMRTRAEIKARIEDEKTPADARAALAWVLGDA